MSAVTATVEGVLGNGTRLCHAFVAWSEGGSTTREVVPIASAVPVLPNQTVHMTARPQRGVFQIDRLIVPPDVAPHFVINDIIIGNRTQMAQADPIPANFFGSMQDAFVSFGPAQIAMDISIQATCISDNPEGVIFRAAFLGRIISGANGLLTFKALALLDDAAFLFTDCDYARVGRITISRLDGEELDNELDGHKDPITIEPRVVGLRVANLKNAERRLYAIDDALGAFVFDLGVDNHHAMAAFANRDGYTPTWFAQLERKERRSDRRRAKITKKKM